MKSIKRKTYIYFEYEMKKKSHITYKFKSKTLNFNIFNTKLNATLH